MAQADQLVRALNEAAKSPQFSYQKARAAARQNADVDWAATKAYNGDFNPEVDGSESFVMKDGSLAAWTPANQRYAARATAR